MVFEQYSSFFALLIYGFLLFPAIILGLNGQKIKTYGMLVSIPALCMVMGYSKMMGQFLVFLLLETLILKGYYHFHKNNKNEIIYYLLLLLSMLPILLVKINENPTNILGFVGISYISFRVWQLIIEMHDGHIEQLPLSSLLYFITFFPTISSGPIDRYNRFRQELELAIPKDIYREEYLLLGARKILTGIVYKFAIASAINVFIMAKLPAGASTIGTTVAYMYAYTLYLFFDFAGYSNFAVGTSYLLGIKSPDNFNKPFLAHDMKEFWERWHISLSKWFGDYVFSRFVLNSLRSGLLKNQKVAIRSGYMVTMTLMGIWHGISIHYLLYGLYQGGMLVITDVYLKTKFYRKFKKKWYYDVVSRVICFQLIAFGMLLFSGYLFRTIK